MSKKGFIRICALSALIVLSGVSFVFAQDEQPSQDPMTKVRKVGKEKERIYEKWIGEFFQ